MLPGKKEADGIKAVKTAGDTVEDASLAPEVATTCGADKNLLHTKMPPGNLSGDKLCASLVQGLTWVHTGR